MKALYGHLDEFHAYHASAKDWSVKTALMANESVFHPFSPGVVKYFQEIGAWTGEHEVRQKELLKEAGL
jgi:TRAP-type uncharacterized transport system substrate-binding protein